MRSMRFILIGLFYFMCSSVQSQNKNAKFIESKPRQNAYIEFGGDGLTFSAAYETRIKKRSNGLGFKIGFGGFSDTQEKFISLPISTNWLFSIDNKNFFEAGIGATFINYSDNNNYESYFTINNVTYRNNMNYYYSQKPKSILGLDFDNENSIIGSFTIGYRRQPSNGGLMWAIAATPRFNKNGWGTLWFGAKFGYSFARKSSEKQ